MSASDKQKLDGMSRPTRARGLKRPGRRRRRRRARVAPHTGAWIETLQDACQRSVNAVAPHTGAWIETPALAIARPTVRCRAPHGRVD